MGKNVAVFVDVANIFYAAKAAGVDIDYVTLLKAATAGRDFVRAYAYTGLDPENENQRNFHSFLSRHGYKVVSKDIRKYGDGKVKANLDIELVVDMMKTARNLDVAIVVSGDGDFAPAIRAVQEMGVRVEVISFRGNTSSDLIDVADIFTDITQLAKVERGSSRSGRRVAEEEFDMTGTDIPDKQTEGANQRQRRTRGRGRGAEDGRGREAEEVAAGGRRGSGEPREDNGRPMTVLPGEKLSRVGRAAGDDALDEADQESRPDEGAIAAFGEGIEVFTGEEPRRRRRRGGRGRGRGRGRPEDGGEATVEAGPEAEAEADADLDRPAAETPRPQERWVRQPPRPPRDDRAYQPGRGREQDEEPVAAPRGPRPTPFGSIWDSQLGMPTGPAMSSEPLSDEELEEPEIPEYLLAERRRGAQGGGGNRGRGQGRGRAGAGYSAAVDRERYGRGGLNRYGEPNRPPQPQAQPQHQQPRQQPRRDERPPQPVRAEQRSQRSDEPWSEVPPEIEEMLRAQMATRPQRPASEPAPARDAGAVAAETAIEDALETAELLEAEIGADAPAAPVTARGRGRRTGTAAAAAPAVAPDGEAAPKARRGRPPKVPAGEPAVVEATAAQAPAPGRGRRTAAPVAETAADAAPTPAEEAAPKRRGRPPKSASAAASAGDHAGEATAGSTTSPSRGRRTRSTASAVEPASTGEAESAAGEVPAKRRRTTRSTTAAE